MNSTALSWGFAEATLFFLVPDVLLSWIALRDPRVAGVACLWAVAGALVGGTMMYAWGAADPEAAISVLDRVPAVSLPMCEAVAARLRTAGVAAVFLGPITGTPYKIYAVQAGILGLGLVPFLAVSVPARLLRFALVTGLVALTCRSFPRLSPTARRVIHVVLWTMFYGWYLGSFRS